MDESEVLFGIGPLLVIHAKKVYTDYVSEAFLIVLLPSGRGLAINWRPKFLITRLWAEVS